jgi:hypothetical protein
VEEHRDHEGTVTPHGSELLVFSPGSSQPFRRESGCLVQTYWLLVILDTAEEVHSGPSCCQILFHVLLVQFDLGHRC